ncbi:MAG: two-component regulator propeller domain-containing protein, partial [Bacteroidia bacterium]
MAYQSDGQNVVKHFTIEDGLPSNEVHFVHQDQQGYFWFCTDRGVSRYNGYEFKNYSVADGLTNNTVFKCFEDWDGNLWFTCIDGSITIYDIAEKRFKAFEQNSWLMSMYKKQLWTHNVGFRKEKREVFFFMVRNYNCDSIHIWDENLKSMSAVPKSVFELDSCYLFDNLSVLKSRRFHSKTYWTVSYSDEPSVGRLIINRSLVEKYEQLFGMYPSFYDKGNLVYACTEEGLYILGGEGAVPLIEDVAATSFLIDKENLNWVTTLNDGV